MIKRLFGFLTGGSKTSRDVFNTKDGHLKRFGSWIGNMKFTQEEMAEMDAEMAKGVRQFAVDTLSENTDRSIARRKLAIFTMQFYCLVIFMSGMTYPINKEWAAFWLSLATDTHLGWLVLGVGTFFWGAQVLRTYNPKKK